jgi:hypothetical protein
VREAPPQYLNAACGKFKLIMGSKARVKTGKANYMLVHFVVNNLGVLIFGFYVLAFIAIIVWKGVWRILPAIPTATMSVILINIYVGTRIDPTAKR